MKRNHMILTGVLFAGLLVLGACEKEKTPMKNDAEIVLNESDVNDVETWMNEEKVTSEETLDVAFIGDQWEKKTALNLLPAAWDKALPESTRFLLIDHKEAISSEKQKQLEAWIKADIVVLFYGENVQPEEVKEKIGMEVGVIQVESDASFDFPYLLYGFGFSQTYEQYLPIFLGSNTTKNLEEKITEFLLTNKNF